MLITIGIKSFMCDFLLLYMLSCVVLFISFLLYCGFDFVGTENYNRRSVKKLLISINNFKIIFMSTYLSTNNKTYTINSDIS